MNNYSRVCPRCNNTAITDFDSYCRACGEKLPLLSLQAEEPPQDYPKAIGRKVKATGEEPEKFSEKEAKEIKKANKGGSKLSNNKKTPEEELPEEPKEPEEPEDSDDVGIERGAPPYKHIPARAGRDSSGRRFDVYDPDEPPESSQGGLNLNKGFLTQILMMVLVALVVCLVTIWVQAPSKKAYIADITRLELDLVSIRDTMATKDNITNINNKLDGYATDEELATSLAPLNNLSTTVTNTVNSAVPTAVNNAMAPYSTRMTNIENRITKLEAGKSSSSSNGTAAETTRWEISVIRFADGVSGGNVKLSYDSYPRKIEEEGFYEIEILIKNYHDTLAAEIGDNTLEIVLKPRDYVTINEDDTYLDSDEPFDLWWKDPEFKIRERSGQDVCLGISFESEEYNFGSVGPNDSETLYLVLELYYA